MADSLAEAEELRRRLVADVAHELRNPLAALRAQVEGIAEGVLPADERATRLARGRRRATSRASSSDLQELSAAEAGPAALRDAAARPGRARRARGRARARARARPGVEVRCGRRAERASCRGDEGRIAQVLRNLLGNALRHTDGGTRHRRRARARATRARVEVRDTGEGIPEEDLPYVFERFYRADAARARDTGGSGIGLAVSRRIVEDHGGEVFARNAEGGGAVVGFELPLDAPDETD